MIVRSRRPGVAFATVLALTLAVAPMPARADTMDEEKFDWPKFLDYASCAASIGFAEMPGGLWMAAITCGRVIQKYWT